MALRRLRSEHYKRMLMSVFPVLAIMFGTYQQFLWDQDCVTYRNKSKLFGGKDLPEGEVAWR
uniref:NADH-ubiquinone oxidoreductase MNLL subunit n=1 Tax=Arion vulgaris TaxID=1028688 RepID=A0A0B6YKF6_9EUPU